MLEDRFEVLEEIGRGPLGKVLRAVDRRAGREVAVRVIDATDVSLVNSLITVATAATRIDHPNVVRVLGCGTGEGIVWVAMELVSGRTLARVLAEEGPFDGERLRRVAIDLCGALAAGHRAGILHRDLKPANVILGDGGLRLMDVGLAHARARAATRPYASPEADHGYPVDERTDLYSLGVLLVELATSAPFDDSAERPLSLGDHIPPALTAVILRLLHKDRGARFRSAASVAEALGAPAPPARSRRRRAVMGLGAVLAVAGVVGVLALVRDRVGDVLPDIFAGCDTRP